jgi:hypothetical protein
VTYVLVDFITIILGVLGWLAVMILGLYQIFRAVAKRVESKSASLPEAS